MSKELKPIGDPEVHGAKIGTGSDYAEIGPKGEILYKGDAKTYDDLTFNFVGRRFNTKAGSIDMDWDYNTAKFQANGDILDTADRVQASETYRHTFQFSEDETDLIPTEWHFHWLQFNTTDQFELELWYRVTNNGLSYKDDYSDWTKLTLKTNDGNEVFPFALGVNDYMLQITAFPIQNIFAQISAEVEIFFTRIDSGVVSGSNMYIKRMDVHCPMDKMGTSSYHTQD